MDEDTSSNDTSTNDSNPPHAQHANLKKGCNPSLEGSGSHDDGTPIRDYVYQSLDYTKRQIRLMRLLKPEQEGDPICLKIETFDLAEAPSYTALSYMWGAPMPRYEVYLESEGSEVVKLLIRQGLSDFFIAYQQQEEKERSDQYFWIDQICIDQSTNSERNHQVQMMSEIYSAATSVIVWLGIDNKSSGTVRQKKRSYVDALEAVAHHGYFHRLWIVQEFLLAKRVRILLDGEWIVYGDSTTLCDTTYLHWNIRKTRAKPVFYRSKAWRASLPSVNYGNDRLDGLILDFAANECEDPRDKIYGLQGLVDPKDRLVVNYAKSTEQVFSDLCNKMLAGYIDRGHDDTVRYPKAKLYTQTRALYNLTYEMRFTYPRAFSLRTMLRWQYNKMVDMWHLKIDETPNLTVGFEKGDEPNRRRPLESKSADEYSEWWLECEGIRQSFKCVISENLFDKVSREHFEWQMVTTAAAITAARSLG